MRVGGGGGGLEVGVEVGVEVGGGGWRCRWVVEVEVG